MTASEGSQALRTIVSTLDPASSVIPSVATRSLKATALSWAAKRGLPETTRLLLGHHSPHELGSMITYSRDSMAAPLRALQELVDEIHSGVFLPDSTRSGYLAPAGKRRPAPPPHEGPAEGSGQSSPPGAEWEHVDAPEVEADWDPAEGGVRVHSSS